MRAVLCIFFALAALPASAEEPPVIGRLFGPAGNSGQGAASSARLRIDGAVARSSAAGTVWINGAPVASGGNSPVRAEASLGTLPEISLYSPGQRQDSAGKRITARVGQTLDMDASQRSDIIPPGAVIRSRP